MIVVITSLHSNHSITPYMYERYLSGLRKQTYRDFHLIAIDDNCKDDTVTLLRKSNLPVTIIRHDKSRGLTSSIIESMRSGIFLCKRCEYVVVHDADDASHSVRFSTQIDYLRKNPKISIVNSSIRICDQNGKIIGHKDTLCSHKDIVEAMESSNPLFHSAVMMRREIFNTVSYDESNHYAQDYGLWFECIKHGFKFGGINIPLLDKCKHSQSISSRKTSASRQRHISRLVRQKYLTWKKENRNA